MGTLKMILAIMAAATPILTVQTLMLNLMAKDRELGYKTELIVELKASQTETLHLFDSTLAQYTNLYSFKDVDDLVAEKANDAEKNSKLYTDKENKKQEAFYQSFFEQLLENAYYQDKNDSTWKLFYYMMNDSAIIVKKKPITLEQYNNLDND